MPEINEALFREVVEDMRLNPETANQANWVSKSSGCGTSYCVAGRACHLSGLEFAWSNFDHDKALSLADGSEIFTGAQELLGLSFQQASKIFYTTRFCDDCGVVLLGIPKL